MGIKNIRFIDKARKVHGDKYDYSKVEYVKSDQKVVIICPIHGEFEMEPDKHLQKKGECPICKKEKAKNTKRLTKEEFIDKARKVHGDKYDYSKVEYVNNHTKICIICPEHGEFWQRPSYHLSGSKCPICAEKNRHIKKSITRENFILESNLIHKNKYDYSKVEYIDYNTKVCIICPEHGEFWQTPHNHLDNKQGCPICGGTSKLSTIDFIKQAQKIHGEKFDYSKVNYVNMRTLVEIKCPVHGWFKQYPINHLQNINGCPQCNSYKKLTNEDFLEKARKKHEEKYNYSKSDVNKRNQEGKICIICPKHGEFWQNPSYHIAGEGCPFCKTSKKEELIINYLKENNIKYSYQHKFEWLKYKRCMPIDFYIENLNLAIEYQGEQHFMPIFYDKDEKKCKRLFNERVYRDNLKQRLCKENGINIEYINYKEDCMNKLKEILDKYAPAN